MLDFIMKQRFEEKKDVPPGAPPPADPPAAVPPKEEEVDDFGYAKEPSPPDEKKDPPKEEKKEGEKAPVIPKLEDIKEPATGYDKEPEKLEDPPKKEDPPKESDEIDKMFDGIPKKEVDRVRALIEKHKPSPELLKDYADNLKKDYVDAKANHDQSVKAAEREKQQIRATWHKELKEDTTFGGANFKTNVARGEKVLEEFMPHTRKALTDNKSMLPPYVMRDLATLADHLYPEQKLVQGDPPPKEEAKDESDSALDFYT